MCVSCCHCTFTKYLYSKYPCCCCCCCCCVFFYHYYCLFFQSNQTPIIMIAKVFIVLALCLVAAQATIIRSGGFQPRFNQVFRPNYGGRFLYGGDFDGMLTLACTPILWQFWFESHERQLSIANRRLLVHSQEKSVLQAVYLFFYFFIY